MVLSWLDPDLPSLGSDGRGDDLVLSLRGGFVFVPEEDAHHVPIQSHSRQIPHQVLEEVGDLDSLNRLSLSCPVEVSHDLVSGHAHGGEGDPGLELDIRLQAPLGVLGGVSHLGMGRN